jgi:hypothetical protein
MHRDFISIWERAGVNDHRLLVCGGPSEVEFQKEVHQRKIDHMFDIRGPVDNVSELLSDLKVFMYPLNSAHYGTGEQVLIEAMACGSVPVVMNNGCERLLVKNGESGVIANDTEQFIQALRYLKNNPHVRQKMSAGARKHALHLIKINRPAEKWHQLYQKVYTGSKRYHRMKLLPVRDFPGLTTTSLLFFNSYGFSKEGLLLQSLIGPQADSKKEDLCNLSPACFAKTRGSPFHYRDMLPKDASIDRICSILTERCCESHK